MNSVIFERSALANGLRIVTAPIPEAHSVTCMIMVAAGSRYETRESSGIAHFSEHMFFKGTERRPTARDIAAEVDAIGGEFNAFTGKEYTGYYVRCAAESRALALDVLVDMIRYSKFDSGEIEREKGVIVEEMNMYFDSPRDYVDSIYESLLFGDQPLGWDVIGTKETVKAATRDTFLDYLGRWYVPSRMVVGLGGRLDGDIAAEVEKLLGDMAPVGSGAPVEADVPSPTGPKVRVQHKTSDQAHLILGTLSRPTQHPDRYVLQVLAAILGGGIREFSFLYLAGPPGSGKTTLAHQIMFALATPERPALYFTMAGEPPLKMQEFQEQFSFFDHARLSSEVRFFSLSDTMVTVNCDGLLKRIMEEVEAFGPALGLAAAMNDDMAPASVMPSSRIWPSLDSL